MSYSFLLRLYKGDMCKVFSFYRLRMLKEGKDIAASYRDVSRYVYRRNPSTHVC